MKRYKYLFYGFITCLLLYSFTLSAQIRITGKVTDDSGLPLPGVVVQQANTQNRVPTDIDGNYSIVLNGSAASTLIFSSVGFTPATVAYTGNATINVQLKTSTSNLDEVVVVGYTSQRKGSITGAVSTVNMGDVETRRVPSVSQVLQGQVAGVQVTQGTGAPGDPIDVRIRGVGTIGDNSPLYIVDGNPTKDISFLNPADIRTMTVLKDAASAAIYGSRAANGVVVITTAQGAVGKSSIELNYFNGVQQVRNLPTMMNTSQYLNTLEQAWNNAGYANNPYTAAKQRTDLADTDWLEELFETGMSQNAQLTASGGSDKVQYLLSGGYYSQNGIVIFDNDKYQRLSFRANVNANLTERLKVGTNLQLSHSTQDWLSSSGDAPGIIRHALLRPPVIPVYKDPSDPAYKANDPFTDLPFYFLNNESRGAWDENFEKTSNPIALASYANDKRINYKTFGNFYGEYAFLKDNSLKLRTNVGIDLNFLHNKAFRQNFGDDDNGGSAIDQGKGLGRQNRPNSLNEERAQELNVTWTNTLNYIKSFDKHAINALVGTEFIKNDAAGLSASRARFDYTSGTFQYIDFGNTSTDLWNGGNGSEYALFSLFGSATYVYNSKYMLTANLRADASSRFGENNQWGYFPSVSAGWTVSEEAFMKDISWLSELKVRASTGKLGNQQIPNYAYLTLLRKDGDRYVLDRYGNPDLKWETTTQNNVGLDIGFAKNSLYFTLDYFTKNTSGILLPMQLPGFVGNVNPTYVNAAEVSNKGLEVGVNYRNSIGDFKYSINGNFATLENEVKALHPNYPNISDTYTRTAVGRPLGAFYGYEMEGIYQNTAEITAHLFGTNSPSEKPGDVKFRDLDGNGILDDGDRNFIGNAIPKINYGFNFAGSFKGFDISFLLQGVEDVDKYNDGKKILDYDTRPFNYTTAALNSWNGEGSSNTVPRVSFTDNGSSRISSIFVEDASYFRIKNVEIGYSLGNLLKGKKTGIQNVRLYVSGQNLYTSTKYTGLDPETISSVDMGTYPQSRAFLFGLNVNF